MIGLMGFLMVLTTLKNKIVIRLKKIVKMAYIHMVSMPYKFNASNPYKIESIDSLSLLSSESEQYEATSPIELKQWLKKLDFNESKYTAIDFGSGKGVAVQVLISNENISKVYGVEISKCLAEESMFFLRGYISNGEVEIINCNAIHVDEKIIDDANLFYFYNPFPELVLRKVVKLISDSKSRINRDIIIIYFNPICSFVVDETFPNSEKIEIKNILSNAKTNIYYEKKI